MPPDDDFPDMPPAVHGIPVWLFLPKSFRPTRLLVAPGVVLQHLKGPWATRIEVASKNLPIPQPTPYPTHLILIDEETYRANLTLQLRAEKKPETELRFLGVDGIVRQLLMTLTLIAGAPFTRFGDYSFRKPEGKSRVWVGTGYGHRQTVGVSPLMQGMFEKRLWRPSSPSKVRSLAATLDRYYRADYWWIDPVSTALGYVWASLTATDGALAFTACGMALEALVATPKEEISHNLAERCALLTARHGVDKLQRYQELKRLYNLRSKIVHGKSWPKRGTITGNSLIVSAKYSNIPIDDLRLMLNITLDTILAALDSPTYLKIVHTKQSDDATTQALNAHFNEAFLAQPSSSRRRLAASR